MTSGNVRKWQEMAQNGTFFGTGDEVIDETGAEELLRAVVLQAARDLKRRNTPACYRRDAAEFLGYLGVSGDKLQEVANIMAEDSTDATQADTMPQWYKDAVEEQRRREAEDEERSAPRRQAAPAPVASPFEGMTAERLDALGVSQQWAGMTGAQLAELQRKQAHRDRAAALGVDWRYLPQDTEVSS